MSTVLDKKKFYLPLTEHYFLIKWDQNFMYLSDVQDENGVTVTVLDRLTKETYLIRCKYLIGADGASSKVVQNLDLPMAGEMGKSGSISIIFKADLTKYVSHRSGYLWWIIQPEANIGGDRVRIVAYGQTME